MNTYDVYLRKGTCTQVTALGYREDKRAGRFYFYVTQDKKDRETFFRIEDVAGIHLRNGVIMTPEEQRQEMDEFNDKLRAAREKLNLSPAIS